MASDFSHSTSAAAGFFFCITYSLKKKKTVCCCCADEGIVETMISLVLFSPHAQRASSRVSNNIQALHINQCQEPPLFLLLCTLNIFTDNKKHPHQMYPLAYFLQRCLTTSTLNSSVSEQVSGKQKRKKKQTNSPPSQPTCGAFTASLQSV